MKTVKTLLAALSMAAMLFASCAKTNVTPTNNSAHPKELMTGPDTTGHSGPQTPPVVH